MRFIASHLPYFGCFFLSLNAQGSALCEKTFDGSFSSIITQSKKYSSKNLDHVQESYHQVSQIAESVYGVIKKDAQALRLLIPIMQAEAEKSENFIEEKITLKKINFSLSNSSISFFVEKMNLGFHISVLENLIEKIKENKKEKRKIYAKISSHLEQLLFIRNKLIQQGLWLVSRYMLKNQTQLKSHSHLEISDFYQIGITGLMIATERYSPKKGKFSTFVPYFINHEIQRQKLEHERVIRLPEYVSYDLKKLQKAIDKLQKEKGASPSTTELAKKTKLKPQKIEALLQILEIMGEIDSLEEVHSEHSAKKSKSLLQFTDFALIIYTLQKYNFLHKAIENAELTEDEQFVIQRFYLSDEEISLKEVGTELGVGRQRASTLHKRAIEKMRLYYNQKSPERDFE
tara:strand:- start:1134 stop:2339 length:1206 start_codon:yes stop_codon:yes gene_type:complete